MIQRWKSSRKVYKKRKLGKYILGTHSLNYMDIYENVLLGTQKCVYDGGVLRK